MDVAKQPAASTTTGPVTFHWNGTLSPANVTKPLAGGSYPQCDTSNGPSLLERMEATFSFFLHRKWVMYSLHLAVPSLLWVCFSSLPMWEPTSGFSWVNATWAVQFLVILAATEAFLFGVVFAFTHDEDDVYITWQEPLAHIVVTMTATVLVPQALDVFPVPYFAPVVASVVWSCVGGVLSFRYVSLMLARKIQSVRADETLSCDEREEELAFLQNPRTKRRVLIAILCLMLLLGSYVVLALRSCCQRLRAQGSLPKDSSRRVIVVCVRLWHAATTSAAVDSCLPLTPSEPIVPHGRWSW